MIKIEWLEPVFDSIYRRLIHGQKDDSGATTFEGIPDNIFYDKRFEVTPYTSRTTTFIITTDIVNVPVYINIRSLTGTDNPRIKTNKDISFVPVNERSTVFLELDIGVSVVTVANEFESSSVVVNTKNYATILYSYSREIFNNIQERLDKQEEAIFSQYATRLVEPLIKYFDVLTNVKSLQIMAVRFLTKDYVRKSTTSLGVKEAGTAFGLNTPYLHRFPRTSKFDPSLFPLLTYQEFVSGEIMHIWLPNLNISRWKAFMIYSDNIDGWTLKDISEDEIVVENNFLENERHVFDFGSDDDFFGKRKVDIDIIAKVRSKVRTGIIAPAYPHDLFVTEDNPLGDERRTFDLAIPFDSGLRFDSEDLDPFHDGFIGHSLTGRMDSQRDYNNPGPGVATRPGEPFSWDTSKVPSDSTPLLSYDKGFYVSTVRGTSMELKLDINFTAGGEYDP